MKPLWKVLIANRGEIARRIQRTCRRMGLGTVAVFSDADAEAPFVAEADEAVRLGPAESAKSYLDTVAIERAITRTGADAVHPGYGFLAENAAFARRLGELGVTFVGPSPESIEAMGLKREAKEKAVAAGVPVVPGYDGRDGSFEAFAREAKRIGYPVLLKASAGGGGKGMRVVNAEDELEAALEGARREGLKSFGDDALILEKYLSMPRHVEVQILGDRHGNVVHLGERDCSVQRRHQKILEEAPAPNLSETMRSALHEAAVRLGKAIDYVGAGTVEFIVSGDAFYFLEVNTRLQVEHPVTEAVFGVDLVEWQLRIAEGACLPESFGPPRGHAIEARLYAEDADFLPQTGTLARWEWGASDELRVDSGVEEGSVVSVHYDPMLAKLIVHGEHRQDAIRRLHGALERGLALGLTTNRSHLLAVLAHEPFQRAELHTGLIEGVRASSVHSVRAAALASLALEVTSPVLPHVPVRFSNHRRWLSADVYRIDERRLEVQLMFQRGQVRAKVREGEQSEEFAFTVLERSSTELWVDEDGHRYRAALALDEHTAHVALLGADVRFHREARFPAPGMVTTGAAVAPMPGTVVAVRVSPGDDVQEGDTLVVIEAMKMEHAIVTASAGRVEAVHVAVGDVVEANAPVAQVVADA